jgi:hypothetical protein
MDINQMKKDREAHEGGPYIQFKEGDTLVYLLPERTDCKVNYVELGVHWGIGPGRGQMVVCFNPRRNPILSNPKFIKHVEARGIKIPKQCPVCAKVDGENLWETDKAQASRIGFKSRYIWLVVEWSQRASAKDDWRETSTKKVRPWMCPKQQWDQISDMFFDAGDITNPDKARLVKLTREGTKDRTKYTAAAALQDPLVLSKEVRAVIAKALKDPELEYEYLAAQQVVPIDEITALMSGVATDDADADAETPDGGPKVKDCFGHPELYNPADPECKACEHLAKCGEACGSTKTEAPKTETKAEEPPVDDTPPPSDEDAPGDPLADEAELAGHDDIDIESLPFTGTLCGAPGCMQPQRQTPDGQVTCGNGHGGAPAFVPQATAPKAAPAKKQIQIVMPDGNGGEAKVEAPKPETKPEQASATKTQAAAEGNMSRLDKLLAQKAAAKGTGTPRQKA